MNCNFVPVRAVEGKSRLVLGWYLRSPFAASLHSGMPQCTWGLHLISLVGCVTTLSLLAPQTPTPPAAVSRSAQRPRHRLPWLVSVRRRGLGPPTAPSADLTAGFGLLAPGGVKSAPVISGLFAGPGSTDGKRRFLRRPDRHGPVHRPGWARSRLSHSDLACRIGHPKPLPPLPTNTPSR